LSVLVLVSAGLFYSSCGGGGDEKTPEEVQLDKLKGTWNLQSASDGTDRTDEYPGMAVTISGTYSEGGTYNYASTADSWPSISPWKAADQWKFKSGNVTTILVRQADLLDMNYTLSNSDNTLSLTFTYSGPGFANGRISSVDGNWAFTFTRQ
jgi:hypothetical protein